MEMVGMGAGVSPIDAEGSLHNDHIRTVVSFLAYVSDNIRRRTMGCFSDEASSCWCSITRRWPKRLIQDMGDHDNGMRASNVNMQRERLSQIARVMQEYYNIARARNNSTCEACRATPINAHLLKPCKGAPNAPAAWTGAEILGGARARLFLLIEIVMDPS